MTGKNSISYEELLESKKGFAPKLLDVKSKSFSEAADALKEHVKSILKEIKEKKGPVEKFVIGKSFARKKQNKDSPFKRTQFDTWNLDGGLNGMWNQTYKKEEFDGMVIFCAVTKNVIKDGGDKADDDDDDEELFNHHDYAKALKQQIVHYFAYEERDKALGNTTLGGDKEEKKKGKAGVLYIVFKVKKEE
ncbi:hypothetical protein ACF0H5_014456 [Mactra antiquata]